MVGPLLVPSGFPEWPWRAKGRKVGVPAQGKWRKGRGAPTQHAFLPKGCGAAKSPAEARPLASLRGRWSGSAFWLSLALVRLVRVVVALVAVLRSEDEVVGRRHGAPQQLELPLQGVEARAEEGARDEEHREGDA